MHILNLSFFSDIFLSLIGAGFIIVSPEIQKGLINLIRLSVNLHIKKQDWFLTCKFGLNC